MNSYEIEIHNMTDDTDMLTVQEALHAAGISDVGDSEVGLYLQDNKPRSIFVDPSDVGAAVEVLNKLGYQTDEDETVEQTIIRLTAKVVALESELSAIKAEIQKLTLE